MKEVPSGSWVSESSDISGYIAGAEWLEFMTDDKEHVWKMRQPVGELWICRFRVIRENDGFRFYPSTHVTEKARKEGSPIDFVIQPDAKLSVSHHGHTTIFRKLK